MSQVEPAPTAVPGLRSGTFVRLCAMAFFGFGHQMVIQPILPFYVADRGGGAALVGIVVAVFSIPSVVLRPLIGSAADRWGHRPVLLAGTAWLAVASLAYLAPTWAAVIANRIGHGTAWAAFNTGGHAALARIAPPARRGEASSFYSLMPAAAQTVMPPLSLALLVGIGMGGPFLLAAACGAVSLALARGIPAGSAVPQRTEGAAGARRSLLLDRRALLPMTLEFGFTSVWPLFFALAPIWAASLDLGVEELGLYFVVYGVVFTAARLAAGRASDRVGRGPVLLAGLVASTLGTIVAIGASGMVGFLVAGTGYAAGAGIFSPTALALAVDRAEPGRLGSAMATYTLGFQAAIGVGAAGWGFVISLAGFPAPFVGALAVNALLVPLIARSFRAP